MSTFNTLPALGYAPRVRRRTATFPARWAYYFDFTSWGGGFSRCNSGPGAIVLKPGICADIQSGRVYEDERFAEVKA